MSICQSITCNIVDTLYINIVSESLPLLFSYSSVSVSIFVSCRFICEKPSALKTYINEGGDDLNQHKYLSSFSLYQQLKEFISNIMQTHIISRLVAIINQSVGTTTCNLFLLRLVRYTIFADDFLILSLVLTLNTDYLNPFITFKPTWFLVFKMCFCDSE